jgi:hypothetical protein
VWWRGHTWREKYRLTRQVVWDGIATGKPSEAILDDLVARGADPAGAVQLYVWFRWERYPWWVRRSSVFGFVQTRPQATQWLVTWAFLGAVLLGVGLLGVWNPSREFGAYWPYLLLAAMGVAARVVWRWRAIRWVDRFGSWAFAGLTPRQLRQLLRDAEASTAEPPAATCQQVGGAASDAEPGAAADGGA